MIFRPHDRNSALPACSPAIAGACVRRVGKRPSRPAKRLAWCCAPRTKGRSATARLRISSASPWTSPDGEYAANHPSSVRLLQPGWREAQSGLRVLEVRLLRFRDVGLLVVVVLVTIFGADTDCELS